MDTGTEFMIGIENQLSCVWDVCSFGVASVQEYSLAAEEGKVTTNGQRGYMKE